MNVICRAIFYSIVLLFISKVGSDTLALHENCTRASYSTATADLMEGSTVEGDSQEFEDDDAINDAKFLAAISNLKISWFRPVYFNFNEFIEEVTPPPPQG